MPVLKRSEHARLMDELKDRWERLYNVMGSRGLKSAREGVKGHGNWACPEELCATIGSDSEIRVAVDDFKTILSELRKLK